MVARTYNFALMRGDTSRLGINIKGLEGTPDAITFSMKRLKQDRWYTFQKTLGHGIERVEAEVGLRYVITILPKDTEGIIPESYYYDVETIINGDVLTILHGTVTIVTDVTRHIGEGEGI